MTAREFRLLSLLHTAGVTLEISPVLVTLHSPNREGQIEIEIEEAAHFDLYSKVKKGIRDNLYQIEDSRNREVQQFKADIENLL